MMNRENGAHVLHTSMYGTWREKGDEATRLCESRTRTEHKTAAESGQRAAQVTNACVTRKQVRRHNTAIHIQRGSIKCVSAQQERCAAKQNNPQLLIQKAHNTTSRSVKGHQKGKHISCDSRQRCTCDTIALLRTQPDTTRSYQTWEQVEQRTARFCASVPSVQHLAVRESHFLPS